MMPMAMRNSSFMNVPPSAPSMEPRPERQASARERFASSSNSMAPSSAPGRKPNGGATNTPTTDPMMLPQTPALLPPEYLVPIQPPTRSSTWARTARPAIMRRGTRPSFSNPVIQPASSAPSATKGTPGMTGTTSPASPTSQTSRNTREARIVIVTQGILARDGRGAHHPKGLRLRQLLQLTHGRRQLPEQVRQAQAQVGGVARQVDDHGLPPDAGFQTQERHRWIAPHAGQADQLRDAWQMPVDNLGGRFGHAVAQGQANSAAGQDQVRSAMLGLAPDAQAGAQQCLLTGTHEIVDFLEWTLGK